MIPLSELLWKRTTLVCRGGVWELVEFAEDIAGMSDRTALFDEADSVEQVITVAHDQGDLPPAEMGFEVPDPQPSAPPAEHQANETPEQVPTDESEGHAELPPEEREQFMPPESIEHAAWVKNHYCVNQGTTPYEKLTSCSYRGKICKFGETVMAYLKQGPKDSAKWQRAIWLGKTVSNDVHVLGVPGGIFVSRSVRRFADCWEGKLASEIDTCVRQHGLVSLGGTLALQNKKLPLPSQPALPIPVERARPPQEIEDAPKSPSNVAGSDPPDSLSVGLPSEGSSMGSHGTWRLNQLLSNQHPRHLAQWRMSVMVKTWKWVEELTCQS